MKNYIVRLETVTTKKNSEIKCKYKAELDLCDDMRFSEIMEFTDQVKMIWRKAMQASRRGDYMEMEVIEAAYAGRLDELKEELEQKNFDRWYFEGRNYEPCAGYGADGRKDGRSDCGFEPGTFRGKKAE